MNPIIIIPARGGSKGVPRKNIRPLNNKPLILYTTDVARELFPDEQIIVSTDDLEIKDTVEKSGLFVPFLRPIELSTDTSSSRELILHALDELNKWGFHPDVVILLQPTSPFRTSTHLSEAIDLYTPDIDMVVSVTETKSNPYFSLFEENEDGFIEKSKPGNYSRRQDCPKVWEFNGAIYIINVKSILEKQISEFTKVRIYPMNGNDSIDIDSEIDWMVCEALLTKQVKE